MKNKLLIVGSFRASEKNIYGGVAKTCETMMKSSIVNRFIIKTVDSTQISNPGPNLIIRGIFALKRLVIFLGHLIFFRPNAVILFTSIGASIVEKGTMAWICRLFNFPVLIFPRGGEIIHQVEKNKAILSFTKFFFKGADMFLCQGEGWKEFAINKLLFLENQVSLVPNWTATEKYLEIGRYKNFNSGKKPIKLLFLGWLEEYKGIFELLNVCEILANDGVDFTLTVAGRGNAEKKSIEFVRKNHLDKFIAFTGWVRDEELASLLTKSDVLVLPSWNEGLPNAMIEAMSSGLAVVITSVGMIPDYVKDKEHALLVQPKNEKLLEEAIRLIISNSSLRVELAKNGHNLVEHFFSLEPAMQIFGDTIERVIANINVHKNNK